MPAAQSFYGHSQTWDWKLRGVEPDRAYVCKSCLVEVASTIGWTPVWHGPRRAAIDGLISSQKKKMCKFIRMYTLDDTR